MGTTYRAVKGSKLTIAEGDDSREWTSEAGTKTAAEDLTFDRSGGWIHGGTGDLVTVGVTIDESAGISKAGVTGARPGTWVMFYYSGAVNPTITGASGTVVSYHNITTAGTYECWLFHKGSGDYSLSIPQAGGSAGDTTPPVVSSMSVENANPNDLVVTLNSVCTFTNIGYTFRVNAVARTLTSVTGNGTNTATFLISGAAIVDTDVLDLAYDSTTGDTIKSSNSVELATFAASTVTNNVIASSFVPHLDANTLIALLSNSATPIDVSQAADGTGGRPMVTQGSDPVNLDGWNTFTAASSQYTKLASVYTMPTGVFTHVIYLNPVDLIVDPRQTWVDGSGFNTSLILAIAGGTLGVRPAGLSLNYSWDLVSDGVVVGTPFVLTIRRDSSNDCFLQLNNDTEISIGNIADAPRVSSHGARDNASDFADISIGRRIYMQEDLALDAPKLASVKQWVIDGDLT